MHPGITFRVVDEQERLGIHIRLLLDGRPERQLDQPIPEAIELMIDCALSGG